MRKASKEGRHGKGNQASVEGWRWSDDSPTLADGADILAAQPAFGEDGATAAVPPQPPPPESAQGQQAAAKQERREKRFERSHWLPEEPPAGYNAEDWDLVKRMYAQADYPHPKGVVPNPKAVRRWRSLVGLAADPLALVKGSAFSAQLCVLHHSSVDVPESPTPLSGLSLTPVAPKGAARCDGLILGVTPLGDTLSRQFRRAAGEKACARALTSDPSVAQQRLQAGVNYEAYIFFAHTREALRRLKTPGFFGRHFYIGETVQSVDERFVGHAAQPRMLAAGLLRAAANSPASRGSNSLGVAFAAVAGEDDFSHQKAFSGKLGGCSLWAASLLEAHAAADEDPNVAGLVIAVVVSTKETMAGASEGVAPRRLQREAQCILQSDVRTLRYEDQVAALGLPPIPKPEGDSSDSGTATRRVVQRVLAAADGAALQLPQRADEECVRLAYLQQAAEVDPRLHGGSQAAVDRLQRDAAAALGKPLPPRPFINTNMVVDLTFVRGREKTALLAYIEAARSLGEELYEPELVEAMLRWAENAYLARSDSDFFHDLARRFLVEPALVQAHADAEHALDDALARATGTTETAEALCNARIDLIVQRGLLDEAAKSFGQSFRSLLIGKHRSGGGFASRVVVRLEWLVNYSPEKKADAEKSLGALGFLVEEAAEEAAASSAEATEAAAELELKRLDLSRAVSAYLLETKKDQAGLLRALAMGVDNNKAALSRFIAAGKKGGHMGPGVASFADEVMRHLDKLPRVKELMRQEEQRRAAAREADSTAGDEEPALVSLTGPYARASTSRCAEALMNEARGE